NCTVQRSRTSTALQALALLNEPVSVDAAAALAKRLLNTPATDSDSDSPRLIHGFQLCTARTPSADELQVLLQLLQDQRTTLQQRHNTANLSTLELEAWTSVATVLLNLHETITRP
ncbi:MAG: DUF1553 domain-containing protein, partial [Planctomycetaceae bacterium]